MWILKYIVLHYLINLFSRMKKTNKLQALVADAAANAVAVAKEAINNASVENSNEEATATPTSESKPKKVTLKRKETSKETSAAPKAKKTKKEKVISETTAAHKASIIENVTSRREVKYLYPEDVTDTLARKTWRQKTRTELHRLELQMMRIQDHNSKEFKKAQKEFMDYQKKVLKPGQVA